MVRIAKVIICAFFLYIYIYSPALVFMPFGLDKLILAVSVLYLIFSGKVKKYLAFFQKEFFLLLLIASFSVLVTTIHNGFSFEGIVMYDIFLFVEVLVVPFCLWSFFSSSWKCDLSEIIICNAILAGCISVALLLNPTWADIMKYQILRIPELLTTNFSYRGFGFSDGLTFSYPVVQGFCAGIIILGLVKRNPIYYFGLIPIMISVFVNARSGIIPVGVAVLLFVFTVSITKTIKTASTFAIILLLVAFLFKPSGNSQLSESVEWGLSFFQIMGDFLGGKDAENMDALSLTGSMVQFPHSISAWIMGEGVNIYGEGYMDYNDSDIGYCIRTVYGGLLYMIVWIVLWVVMYRRIVKKNREMALLLFISLIYLNWKSDFFVVTASCRFFFFIYVCCIMDPSFMKINEVKSRFKKLSRNSA